MLDIESIAKKLVCDDFKKAWDRTKLGEKAKENDFYVVWKCKTLQNWKTLVSTDIVNGFYWEITYNGDKKEFYIDRYCKHLNTCVKED